MVFEQALKRSALLLVLPLACLRLQLDYERALRTHVRNHERADLAARVETIGME